MTDHRDISRQMQEVERTLKELGMPLDKLDEVLAQIDNYQSLNKELQEARKKQFFNDAWSLMQIKGSSKESQISEFLRSFAEHAVQRACDVLNDKPEMPLDEIVDLIPPMESKGPYDE